MPRYIAKLAGAAATAPLALVLAGVGSAEAAAFAGATPSTAAHSHVTAGLSAAKCEVRVYKPEMRKGHVAATGWAPGCAKTLRITITLQHHRAWGWDAIKQLTFYAPGPRTIYKGCKKGTTFTYRLAGTFPDSKVGYSPQMRAKCR